MQLYEREKAAGTELPAIIGLLRDHVEREEERIRVERGEAHRLRSEQDRIAREQRLLSGADCNWTQPQIHGIGVAELMAEPFVFRLPKTKCGTSIA